MHLLRLPALGSIVIAAVSLVVGCSASEDEKPAPSEPLVFDATEETKAELAIARWGFVTDPFQDTVTYRGYGENNEVLATVVQKAETTSDKHTFTMTMTGPKASARETIEYSIERSASMDAQLMMDVTENTFAEGAVPMRVLIRFQADSATARAKPTPGLLQTAQLVSTGNDLVDVSRETLVKYCPNEQAYRDAMGSCSVELVDWRTAASGESGSCSLLKTVRAPLLACGVGAILTSETGPGAILGCLGGGYAGALSAREECAAARKDNSKAREKFDRCFRTFCPPSMRAR